MTPAHHDLEIPLDEKDTGYCRACRQSEPFTPECPDALRKLLKQAEKDRDTLAGAMNHLSAILTMPAEGASLAKTEAVLYQEAERAWKDASRGGYYPRIWWEKFAEAYTVLARTESYQLGFAAGREVSSTEAVAKEDYQKAHDRAFASGVQAFRKAINEIGEGALLATFYENQDADFLEGLIAAGGPAFAARVEQALQRRKARKQDG